MRHADLVGPLAHPQDQVRLRDLAGAEALRDPQHLERAVVAERGADPVVQPPHRLQVVGEDVGLGVEHRRDVGLAALEVARQHLDADPGDGVAARADRRRPDPSAAVGQVVARDAR